MNGTNVTARRVTRTYRQVINASPDDVFGLLCPVREAEWLDGWKYTMLFSQSGLVEDGAVFSTPGDGEEDTVWIVTRHDVLQRAVEFTRFTPGSRASVLRIGVTPKDEGRSHVGVSYTYTAIAAAGNTFIDRFTEEAFREAVTFWENSMNHWLETGERLAKDVHAVSHLSQAEIELVALGAAMGSNCVPCIQYHIPEARKAGLTDGQITEAIRKADKVRQVPARKVLDTALEMLHEVPADPSGADGHPRAVGAEPAGCVDAACCE